MVESSGEITLPPGGVVRVAAEGPPSNPPANPPAESARSLIERGQSTADPQEQLKYFERAHALDMNDPTAMSLHGMTLAIVRHRYQEGIVFCEEAVRRYGPSPELLVNLARAYIAGKSKREAVRCLRRALARSNGTDERARIELQFLGLRRRPVIPFLPRSFFLNKILGRWRHTLLDRRAARDDGEQPIPAELGQLSGDLKAAEQAMQQPAPSDQNG